MVVQAVKDVCESKHDKKRVYYSEVKDFNPLDCVVSKIKIVKLSSLVSTNSCAEIVFAWPYG